MVFVHVVYSSDLYVRDGYGIAVVQAVPRFYSTNGFEAWVATPTLNSPLQSEIEFAFHMLQCPMSMMRIDIEKGSRGVSKVVHGKKHAKYTRRAVGNDNGKTKRARNIEGREVRTASETSAKIWKLRNLLTLVKWHKAADKSEEPKNVSTKNPTRKQRACAYGVSGQVCRIAIIVAEICILATLLYFIATEIAIRRKHGQIAALRSQHINYILQISPEIDTEDENLIKKFVNHADPNSRSRYFLQSEGVSSDIENAQYTRRVDIGYGTGCGAYDVNEVEYVPVGHFYWLSDGVDSEGLMNPDLQVITLAGHKGQVEAILNSLNSDPMEASGEGNVAIEGRVSEVADVQELVDQLAEGETLSENGYVSESASVRKYGRSLHSPHISKVGLIPVEDVVPKLKVLEYAGIYYPEWVRSTRAGVMQPILSVAKKEDVSQAESPTCWALTAGMQVKVPESQGLVKKLREFAKKYDPPAEGRLGKVNMTGVTAISRNLASKMEREHDYAWPAHKIAAFLADADLTHTSNEVSFVHGCTPEASMRFCSKPEYIATLDEIGLDVVELTGNHNNDYGAQANADTIRAYKGRGWEYFGGGLDSTDAGKTLVSDVNGTKVAFLGYNFYDTMLGTGAIATDRHAGANRYSAEVVKQDISKAHNEYGADIVVVDYQFQECYSYPSGDVLYPICYKPLSYPDQRKVFRATIDDGADIVIGTQAHQPQTYEVYGDGLIFYGLGNLFFDQTPWIGTRQGLILTHYMYGGRLWQTRLTTTQYDSDMQVYISKGDEKELLMEMLREARD